MSEVIVITSGKGGVGKTTTAANIGIGLAQLGKKVVMVDTDIGLRNLDVVLGLENRIVYNLVDVVEGNCRMKQALIRDKRYEQLYLLPSAQTRDKTSVTPEQMKKLCDELKQSFDFVLLDCPAGIEQGFANAVAGANKAIVVTTPEVSAIRDADRIIGLLEAQDLFFFINLQNKIQLFFKTFAIHLFPLFFYMYSRSLSVLDFTRVHLSHTDQKQCQPCDQHAAARNRAENRHSVADLFFFKALHSHIEAVSRQKE